MRARAGLVALLLVLPACGGSSADSDVIGEFDGLVTLEALGSGDTALLRYDMAEGLSGSNEMSFVMSMSTEIGGIGVPAQMMAYSMLLDWEVTARNPDGSFDVVTEFVAVDADPELRDALDAMVGIVVRQKMSDRGEILDVQFDMPPGIDPAFAATMDQMAGQVGDMAAPLPSEPVAVGARWTHEATTITNGVETTVASTYEVTAIEAGKVTLGVTLNSADSKVDLPDLPAGTSVVVDVFDMTGSGVTVLDLQRPLPAAGSSRAEMTMEATIQEGSQGVSMSMNMTMEMTITER